MSFYLILGKFYHNKILIYADSFSMSSLLSLCTGLSLLFMSLPFASPATFEPEGPEDEDNFDVTGLMVTIIGSSSGLAGLSAGAAFALTGGGCWLYALAAAGLLLIVFEVVDGDDESTLTAELGLVVAPSSDLVGALALALTGASEGAAAPVLEDDDAELFSFSALML